jgi:beta-galactosidase
MRGERFNDGWSYRARVGAFGLGSAPAFEPVHLPHDAMLAAGRDPDGNPAVAHYRSGAHEYEKRLDVPAEWRDKSVFVVFEGVYRDAAVFLNADPIAQWPFGYGEAVVRLDDHLVHGAENVLRVECRNGDDSRWYSGAGIYRDVTLFVVDPVHVAFDGVRVTTPELGDDVALAVVETEVENDTARRTTVEVLIDVVDPDGVVVARERQPLTVARTSTATARARLLVSSPRRWSTAEPNLYTCTTRVVRDGAEVDVATTTFGFRTLTVDPVRGLRINGETVKLRGACIHHDNGVLGAATFAAAEERRVVRLKQAGFNALRMAHHPMSRPLLDACDRHGVLVMDEAFDMWRIAKTEHDYAAHFPTSWQDDLAAMVRRDVNHPSVILYSIGNEIEEVGAAAGAQLGREMAELVRSIDPTRPVTNGVNFLLPALRGASLNEALASGEQVETILSELVTGTTEESFAVLDVAGYNYADGRYVTDGDRFPNRVIVGSETFPRTIDRSWRAVLDCDHVIGDFTWTGWDYLGEVGVGRVVHEDDPVPTGLIAEYPWRTAACGDIDIAGHRLPVSYYREIVFGLRSDPYIAVRPPALHAARKVFASAWAWSTAVESWTWDGDEGCTTTVEVYASANEVELLLDGRSLGRAPAGEPHRFTAKFEVAYEPGELTAIAYRAGEEVGRTSLRTADAAVHVQAVAERDAIAADGSDVLFVDISFVDAVGTVHPGVDREVVVVIEGPGVLQGLGSAAPMSEESFLTDRCTTFRGRALAVIRSTGAGEITARVAVADVGQATVSVTAVG